MREDASNKVIFKVHAHEMVKIMSHAQLYITRRCLHPTPMNRRH